MSPSVGRSKDIRNGQLREAAGRGVWYESGSLPIITVRCGRGDAQYT